MKNFLLLAFLAFAILSCTPQKREEVPNELKLMPSPAGERASLPYLLTGEDGKLYFSWVEKKDSNWVELKYAMLQDGEWTRPQLIARGNDWFVNWADYPMMAVDKEGNMIAHFLAKSSSGTYSYDVNVVSKRAGGEWSDPMVPHTDGTPTEHGFVTMLPQNDGTFRLAWLDGRNTKAGSHSSEGAHGTGAMTIRSAVLDLNGQLTEEVELDSRVCDCCQTGGTMTKSGPVFVYRDRSEMEIRDISFVRLVDQQWSDPKPVSGDNWNISGCPVNGPRMVSNGDNLAAAWFTAADGQPKVKVAFSPDSKSFGEEIVVDQTGPLGRVDIALLDEGTAIVSWLDNDSVPVIKYRTVRSNGTMDSPTIVAETSESRGSGFPQLAQSNGKVYFAWTKYEDKEGTEIMMAQLRVLN